MSGHGRPSPKAETIMGMFVRNPARINHLTLYGQTHPYRWRSTATPVDIAGGEIAFETGTSYLHVSSLDVLGASGLQGEVPAKGNIFLVRSRIDPTKFVSYQWGGTQLVQGSPSPSRTKFVVTAYKSNGSLGDNEPVWAFAIRWQDGSTLATYCNSLFVGSSTFFATSGTLTLVHLADASAPNDSLYYSTTQSKLVYKDSGGTVNVLY